MLAAWREYLARDNRGRGVVLIGHSQGTRMLRQLVREEIDPRPEVRRRLVSAVLLGGDVLVRRGTGSGGDFANVPACTAGDQLGCVIAWSTFFDPPPADARFGRYAEDEGSGLPDGPTGPDLEVLCTDPSVLAGRAGEPLETLARSEPFPGVLGAGLVATFGGPQPSAPTPWIQPRDRYTARCERSSGVHVLRLAPVGLARRLNPFPDPTWGVHLVDGNIALGELVAVVGRQSAAYVRREARRGAGRGRPRCLSRRARLGPLGAGRVTVGRSRRLVVSSARSKPVRAGRRVLRWCVADRRGRA